MFITASKKIKFFFDKPETNRDQRPWPVNQLGTRDHLAILPVQFQSPSYEHQVRYADTGFNAGMIIGHSTVGSPFNRLRIGRAGMLSDRNITLRLSIASLIFVLLLSLAVILTLFNFIRQADVARDNAAGTFNRIGANTRLNLTLMFSPLIQVVNQTSRLGDLTRNFPDNVLNQLPYFAQTLDEIEQMQSLYFAMPNGNFFQVRSFLHVPEMRQLVGAPDTARYVVRIIRHNAKNPVLRQYLYFDEVFRLLGVNNDFINSFDPRVRPWYQLARKQNSIVLTDPYVFSNTRAIGATIAKPFDHGGGVIAADVTMEAVSALLQQSDISSQGKIILFDKHGTIIASSRPEQMQRQSERGSRGLRTTVNMSEIGDPVIEKLYGTFLQSKQPGELEYQIDGVEWFGAVVKVSSRERMQQNDYFIGVVVPEDELTRELRQISYQNLGIAALVLLLAFAVGWRLSSSLSANIDGLHAQAKKIQALQFDQVKPVSTRIVEIADLSTGMQVMKSALQKFISMGRTLARESDYQAILQHFVSASMDALHCDAACILLLTDDARAMQVVDLQNRQTGRRIGRDHISLETNGIVPLAENQSIIGSCVQTGKIQVINRFFELDEQQTGDIPQWFEEPDFSVLSSLVVPLSNQNNEVIGVLVLLNGTDPVSGRPIGFDTQRVQFAQAFVSSAALLIDNKRLLKAQKDMFDAFIQLLAGAIDTKSPYTGGHCQRVPELSMMLADAACDSTEEPFRTFQLNTEEKYELHIAGWLHDCGKVTTPEYVVDKSTKLETIYNRIHEVRMRFEVLLRDARLAYYEAILTGGDKLSLEHELEIREKTIREDFAFVAESNIGGEFMDEDRLARLQAIAEQTWERHLDDRQGLSQDEQFRYQREQAPVLPVREALLADRDYHLVKRENAYSVFGDNPFGFDMAVPEHHFNFGELYNLSIARGTLTDEERFKINEHIVQTLVMLKRLPFPRELQRVPDWAANHHEAMNGKGYPRRLTASDLTIPERIMAIADIFEALTAADRPYKKAKTLSESVRIMGFMCKDGHICPDLFRLFLQSGVYRDYAKRFLKPDQIDDVDIESCLQ